VTDLNTEVTEDTESTEAAGRRPERPARKGDEATFPSARCIHKAFVNVASPRFMPRFARARRSRRRHRACSVVSVNSVLRNPVTNEKRSRFVIVLNF
jgi:hypothetical protein